MNLLHPEVEITPGRAGKRPTSAPYQEREKLDGSVVVRLTNETAQENAYTVRLRCENPFWQEGWYTVQSLPAAPGAQNAAPAGKPDVRGHGDRSVKVFVPRGGTREILIRFNVPARPESRAGRYEYAIEIETQVTLAQEGAGRRKDRLTLVPAIANVRPYYKWSLDLTPELRRVTRRRRTGEFEVIVTNEGNDWLYCDLQLPRPKDLLLDCPTLRLAVPPPEPGELLPGVGMEEGRPGTQRVVPLLATTRLKIFRGELTPQPLSVTAQRVDAPSLPPPPEDGFLSLGSVVANGTTEIQPAPPDRALVYAPPVPAKLLDFFSRGAGSLRAWIAPLLMLLLLVPATYLAIQNLFFKVKIDTLNLPVAGKKLFVTGPGVLGSRVIISGKRGSEEVEPYAEDGKPDGLASNKCFITLPARLDHVAGKITVQRAGGIFSFLSFALPSDVKNIQIGTPLVPMTPEVVQPADGSYPPGKTFQVGIKGFSETGQVLLNQVRVVPVGWAADHVTIKVPESGKPNQQFVVALMTADSSKVLPAGSVTVTSPAVVGGLTSGGGSGGSSNGAKPPVSGGGGGGGAKPPTAGGGGGAKPPTAGGGGAKPPLVAKVVLLVPAHTHNPPNIYRPSVRPPVITPPRGNSQAAYTALLTGDLNSARLKAANSDAFGQAIEAYADIRQNNPAPAAPLIAAVLASSDPQVKAMALVAQGASQETANRDAAKQSYDQAITTDPGLLFAYLIKAEFLYNSNPTTDERKEADLALKTAFKQSATNSGQKAAVYYTTAKIYAATNRTPAAMVNYQKGRALMPSLPKPPGLP